MTHVSELQNIRFDYDAGVLEIPYTQWDLAPADLKTKWLNELYIQLTLW